MIFGKTGKAKKIEDFPAFEQDMLTVSANVLANIPAPLRAQAVEQAAEYIASVQGVVKTKAELAAAIEAKVAALWTLGVGQEPGQR